MNKQTNVEICAYLYSHLYSRERTWFYWEQQHTATAATANRQTEMSKYFDRSPEIKYKLCYVLRAKETRNTTWRIKNEEKLAPRENSHTNQKKLSEGTKS